MAAVVGGGFSQVRAAPPGGLLPDRRAPHLRDRRLQPRRDGALRPVRHAPLARPRRRSATSWPASSAARPTSSTATTSTSRSSGAAPTCPCPYADAREVMLDNPMGQGDEMTPVFLITAGGLAHATRGHVRHPPAVRMPGPIPCAHGISIPPAQPLRPHAHRDGHPDDPRRGGRLRRRRPAGHPPRRRGRQRRPDRQRHDGGVAHPARLGEDRVPQGGPRRRRRPGHHRRRGRATTTPATRSRSPGRSGGRGARPADRHARTTTSHPRRGSPRTSWRSPRPPTGRS